jgi:hypothetical protein
MVGRTVDDSSARGRFTVVLLVGPAQGGRCATTVAPGRDRER